MNKMEENNQNLYDNLVCLEYLKNEYDRAILREKTLEYKLGILWTVLMFIIMNTKETLFPLIIDSNNFCFINVYLILKILILNSFIFISYFSYNFLKLYPVFRASTYQGKLLKIINTEEKRQQLIMILIYIDMIRNRDGRCDNKSKNLNNAIKSFFVFLILVIILHIIKFGG